MDKDGIGGFSLFKTLPLKESFLFFKDVKKFDEKIKDSQLSIRDNFYFMSAFCGVCDLVSKIMDENGMKSLSELKGYPQMESFYSFKKIADQRIKDALKSNKVDKSQVESIREIIDQFESHLEKEHLLSLAKKHDKAPQQRRINKI